MDLQRSFDLFSVAGALCVVLAARLARGPLYARFAGVLLTIHTFSVLSASRGFPGLIPVLFLLQLSVFGNFFALIWAKLRGLLFRLLISWPGAWFVAGTFLALPWAGLSIFGLRAPGLWLPYLAAAFGFAQSAWGPRESEVSIVIDDERAGPKPLPMPSKKPIPEGQRPLRIIQLTDTHLGPFMSVSKLRRLCERAVARNPDLILLTGDFLTMESQTDATPLATALEPLTAFRGRVFACRGNHDLESPELVDEALRRVHVRLLNDEAEVVDTPAGKVQILGFDFIWRRRPERMAEVCRRFPREPGCFRLVLLHDPGAFRHLPEGEGDLVLSGHTHGGQLGLLSLGLPWTVLRPFSFPDHGLWQRGPDRLYVHRGTAHYGFPLRIGVPSESSLMSIYSIRAR